jgi:hypothetical protein
LLAGNTSSVVVLLEGNASSVVVLLAVAGGGATSVVLEAGGGAQPAKAAAKDSGAANSRAIRFIEKDPQLRCKVRLLAASGHCAVLISILAEPKEQWPKQRGPT